MHWFPQVTDEQYVASRGWEIAVLESCPFHAEGGCGVQRHGSYARVHPAGVRVARYWCPRAARSISLLPAFLASRLSSTLGEIEAAALARERAPSLAAAAECARPPDREDAISDPKSAQQWLSRRVRAVDAVLVAAITLLADRLAGCAPTITGMRARLGCDAVLVEIRRLLGAKQLRALGPPLGLCARDGG